MSLGNVAEYLDLTKSKRELLVKCSTRFFCVREFIKTESVTAVQRAFLLRFNIQPPTRKSICRWKHQFEQIGCLCKGKSADRSRVSEENVRRGCTVAILLSTDTAARLCARLAL